MSKKPTSKTAEILKMRETQHGSLIIKPFSAPGVLPTWKTAKPYIVGDGDHNIYIPRVGSCHKHLLSFGDRT